MKKLEIQQLENINGCGPKLCWGAAGYYSATVFMSGIGLVIGAACLVSSL